jgi:kinesin family protein 3/17
LEKEIKNGLFVSTVEISPCKAQLCLIEYIGLDQIGQQDTEGFVSDPNNYNLHTFTFDQAYD